MNKIKIAFFSLTDCQGCYFEFLDLQEELLRLLKKVEITHFKMIRQNNKPGPYHISFVQGGTSTKEEIENLKKIREQSAYLVAFGTCACWGGIPRIVNEVKRPEKIVYEKPIKQKSIPIEPIEKYVKVDYSLKGCPFEKTELIRIIKDFIMKKIPKEKEQCVCVECKLRENECLLENGIPCMGPISAAGCLALCPSIGVPCDNCRGPTKDVNVDIFVEILKKIGIKDDDIKMMLSRYAGDSEKFKRWLD